MTEFNQVFRSVNVMPYYLRSSGAYIKQISVSNFLFASVIEVNNEALMLIVYSTDLVFNSRQY